MDGLEIRDHVTDAHQRACNDVDGHPQWQTLVNKKGSNERLYPTQVYLALSLSTLKNILEDNDIHNITLFYQV